MWLLVLILPSGSRRPSFTAKVMAWSVVKVDRGRPDLGFDSNVPLAKVLSTAFDMAKVLTILRTERPIKFRASNADRHALDQGSAIFH